MTRQLPAILLLALLAVIWPEPAAAKRPKRVVIMSADDATYQRLRAELSALGWATHRMPAHDTHLDLIGLHAGMTHSKAGAAIALLPAASGGVQACIVDEVGMVVSEERFDAATPPELVVLRTVEKLRAYRLRLTVRREARGPPPAPRPSPQRADAEPPPLTRPVPRVPAAVSAATQLNAGLSLGWAPGGLSPTGQVRLGAAWLPSRWFAADLVVLVPVVPARISADKGETDLYLALLAAAARWLGGNAHSRIRPTLGAGIGALFVHVRGHALADGYTSERELRACALPFVEGGVAIRLSEHVRLVASHLVGFALPRLVVTYGGQPVASLGKPMLTGTIGLELGMP